MKGICSRPRNVERCNDGGKYSVGVINARKEKEIHFCLIIIEKRLFVRMIQKNNITRQHAIKRKEHCTNI